MGEGNISKQDYETNPQANEYHWEVYHYKQRWISALWVKNHNPPPPPKNKEQNLLTYCFMLSGKKVAIMFSAVS